MNVLIIGGGPAGVTAALRASELGAQVTLVEAGRLGGTCTNDGCVPVRALARAARLWREMAGGAEHGLMSEAFSVDFARLLARSQQVVYEIHEKKQLLRTLESLGVNVVESAGEARFIDAHTVTAGRRVFKADRFILCAGGRPLRLPFPGAEHTLTQTGIWQLKSLPASLVVIGGAATGCQIASIFAAFGSQVTIVELAPRLLPAEDEMVSRTMQAAFARRGIQIRTGSGAERVDRRDGKLFISCPGSETLTADTVLMAVGWPGNLASLNLPAAGIETRGNYIKVDEHMCTSSPHIFAAGDITGRMMLVQSANQEARVAAENAVLGIGERSRHAIVPHGGFTDPEYGGVGLTEDQARNQAGTVVAEVAFAELDRAVIDGLTEGACKLIVSSETHRILGAHVVGEQAVEIVQIAATAMAADMWVEQLAELELAYPTYTAVLGLVARRIVAQLGVMPLAPTWHALGRPAGAEWERREAGGPDPSRA